MTANTPAGIQRDSFRASIALLAAMVLWASSFIALKFAFRTYDPMVVIFGRMVIGSLCLLGIFFYKRTLFQLEVYEKGDWRLLLSMVLCEPCLYFVFEAEAIVNTTASQAGVITSILPLLVSVAAAIFLKEKMTRRVWGGLVAAFIGAVWLTLANAPNESALNPILGNFYEFLAMLCAAGQTIIIKRLSARYSPFFLTAVHAFAGALFFLPLLFLPSTNLPQHFDWWASLAVVYLGAVITMGAYGLYNYALKFVPASRAAACVNLIPIFSVILGWSLLGETLTGGQIVAGALIITGVYFTQR